MESSKKIPGFKKKQNSSFDCIFTLDLNGLLPLLGSSGLFLKHFLDISSDVTLTLEQESITRSVYLTHDCVLGL